MFCFQFSFCFPGNGLLEALLKATAVPHPFLWPKEVNQKGNASQKGYTVTGRAQNGLQPRSRSCGRPVRSPRGGRNRESGFPPQFVNKPRSCYSGFVKEPRLILQWFVDNRPNQWCRLEPCIIQRDESHYRKRDEADGVCSHVDLAVSATSAKPSSTGDDLRVAPISSFELHTYSY